MNEEIQTEEITIYTPKKLAKILDNHRKWRFGTGGTRADLTRADLTGANLSGADLTRADLTGANLSGADLTRADLTRADLTRANLSDVNLSDADLSGANLSSADLTRANLTRADLTRADLYHANLTRANLTDANLNGEKITISPVQVGLDWVVTIGDTVMRIGCQTHTIEQWREFSDAQIRRMDNEALAFWATWKGPLLAMADAHTTLVKAAAATAAEKATDSSTTAP